MADKTRREWILEAFAARLATIRTAAGFATDAGDAVYIGVVPALTDDKDPTAAIALIPGNEDPLGTMEHVNFRWDVEIGAVVKIGANEAWRLVEQVIGDIKQAVETPDRTLEGNLPGRIERGPVVAFPRESGQTVTGASVFYSVPYPEPWGAPRLAA